MSDEAIQTIIGAKSWIASLTLAMTERDMQPRSRGAMRPGFAVELSLRKQRAQGKPDARLHPQPRMQTEKAYE